MRKYLMISAIAFASCAGNNSKTTDTTAKDSVKKDSTVKMSAPAQNMEYCFVHTDGTNAQDTTAVHLMINSGKVTGNMYWLPKEKDQRKGTLEGTMSGNDIKAVWSFNQEGQADTMAVEFKLSSQQLAQKPFAVDSKTGRQYTDSKADYSVMYNMDNCNKFKK